MIGHDTIQQWWGNTVFKHTADWHATPLRVVPEGEHFGCVLACAALCVVYLGLADVWRADRTLGRICCCSIRCICCCHLLSSLAYALGVGHRSCQGGGVLSAWNATGSLRAGVLGLGFDACMPGRVRALTYCRRRPRPIDAHRCARMHAVIIFGLRGCGYVCMCIHAGWGVREMRTGGVSMTGR